jgi:hypothetical protein
VRFEEVYDRLERIESLVVRGFSSGGCSGGGSSRTVIASCANGRGGFATRRVPVEKQYLGASSIASLSEEAGSLAEERLNRRGGAGGEDARELGPVSMDVAGWFPYYGHAELRARACAAKMDVPERGVAGELVDGGCGPFLSFDDLDDDTMMRMIMLLVVGNRVL